MRKDKNEAKRKQKKRHPILIALIILFALTYLGSSTSNNEDPTATTSPSVTATATPTEKPTEAPTATPTTAPTSTPTEAPTSTPTSTPAPTPTNTPAPTPEEDDVFTVEHDEEYYATQEYIYKFLTEKGYEVQTIIGVPNIGRIEDNDPDDLTVPWYAYVMHKGKWTQFNVLLFNGEVSFIRPMQ